MIANSKTELLDITRKEYSKLRKLIDAIDDEKALQKVDENTSIKDVIGHRAHWINFFLGWYSDGLTGHQVFFPAQGYKWNDLKRYNAELRLKQTNLS